MKKHIVDIVYFTLLITALSFSYNCKAQLNKDRTWSIYKTDENSSNYSPLVELKIKNYVP